MTKEFLEKYYDIHVYIHHRQCTDLFRVQIERIRIIYNNVPASLPSISSAIVNEP